MLRISTLDNHSRLSTQDLLSQIAAAVAAGETDFQIAASGQHDIGGPLWNAEGRELRFTVSNPGQRVGSMCLPGTSIIVDGPAPADVGWLNAGGLITVKGDAGDTAGHCAAGGTIYIGGRAGTRSGSLMKHDPLHDPPELWILNSTGSFSFEFMSGGRAVVCGHDSQLLPSVLGERPCVGMVGGVVYFRGPHGELPDDVLLENLDDVDIAWLEVGLDRFLEALGQTQLKRELSLWKHWRKLVPAPSGRSSARQGVASFHAEHWIEGGLFGDVLQDRQKVFPLVATGAQRLNWPEWHNETGHCTDCRACLKGCPQAAIRRREGPVGVTYSASETRCIGCGICKAVCPEAVWQMIF